MLKDKQNLSHNVRGNAIPLKTWLQFLALQYHLSVYT